MKNRGPGGGAPALFLPISREKWGPPPGRRAPRGAAPLGLVKAPTTGAGKVPPFLYYFSLSPHRDRPDPYTDRKDGIGMAMEEKRLPGEPGGHRITLVAGSG